jgi:hypothetical protein
MRKLGFKTAHDYFEGSLRWWSTFLTEVLDSNTLVTHAAERHEILDTSVLRLSALWEMLVHRDLVSCVNRDSSALAKSLGLRLPKHLSRDLCEGVLFGTRYLDFRSVRELQQFAKRHLTTRANLFTHIPPGASQHIDSFFIIRNLVSHYSSFAERSYVRMLKTEYGFERSRAPGDFLMARENKPGRPRRIFRFIDAFRSASHSMRSAAEKL